MNQALPTISVVMPNFNHAHFLERALTGLLEQTNRAQKIIIVDDGSTDTSVEIIKKFQANHPEIVLIENGSNHGPLYSVNKGLKEVTSDFVFINCADDKTLPDFFKTCMKMAAEYPKAGVIFGTSVCVRPDGKRLWTYKPESTTTTTFFEPQDFLKNYLMKEVVDHTLAPSTIYRVSDLKNHGYFRSELGHLADTFVIRAISLEKGALFIAQEMVLFTVEPTSFGVSQLRDPSKMFAVAKNYFLAMESKEYAHIFPAQYVQWLKKEYPALIIDRYIAQYEKSYLASKFFLQQGFLVGPSFLKPFSFFLLTLAALFRRLSAWWLKCVMRSNS